MIWLALVVGILFGAAAFFAGGAAATWLIARAERAAEPASTADRVTIGVTMRVEESVHRRAAVRLCREFAGWLAHPDQGYVDRSWVDGHWERWAEKFVAAWIEQRRS